MSQPENLWGFDAIQPAEEAVPKKLLLEQAELLQNMTGRKLFATVESRKTGEIEALVSKDSPIWLDHDFMIFAPFLDGYSVHILTISHDATMYPCKISSARMEKPRACANEAELRGAIREILSHPDTVKIIRALMAQAQAA